MHATEQRDDGMDAKDWGRFAYSVRDVADMLAISQRMVRYLVQTGELASFKVGAARRIHGTSIRDYVRKHGAQERAS